MANLENLNSTLNRSVQPRGVLEFRVYSEEGTKMVRFALGEVMVDFRHLLEWYGEFRMRADADIALC